MNNFSLDTICAALGLDPLAHGLQVIDAAHLAQTYFPPLDPDSPALVARLASSELAARCEQVLLQIYPRTHLVTRYDAEREKTATLMLDDLGALNPVNTSSALFIPPLGWPGSFNALANIVAHLRAPEGCPWDRAQTHQSLRKDFLEECYEVLETLDDSDIPHLREELGDLMLHILLQTQIAYQADEFNLSEMLAEISEKLVRRHPHVFADVVVNGTDEIIANWERIKDSEEPKARSGKKQIPLALPALMRAQRIAKKQKELVSVREIQKLAAGMPRAKNRERALGQVLFALAAYAQEKHLDAETALRMASDNHITTKALTNRQ